MGSFPSSVAMQRYTVVVITHSGTEVEYVVLTTGGETKAAYIAGSAFAAEHPRTGIATFRVERTVNRTGGRRSRRTGIEPGALVDRMEW